MYFFVLLGIMFFLMFNCVFLSALLYVLLPSGVINHVCMCMYVCMYVYDEEEWIMYILDEELDPPGSPR